MATCEYCRVNRSISKSTTRSMAHLPGHCHRLHPADRLPVGPLLPGGIPATAPPARRPHRRGLGPPLPRPGRRAPGRYVNALRHEQQALALFRDAADQIGLALLETLLPLRPTYPTPGRLATGPGHPRGSTPPRRRPSPRQVWLTPTPRRLRVRDDHLPQVAGQSRQSG